MKKHKSIANMKFVGGTQSGFATCRWSIRTWPEARSASTSTRVCLRPGGVPSCFFFQAEDGIRDLYVTGVQTCALPIFEVTRGECVSIVGPSGSGKTTLLRCINFLERPTGGRSEERRVGKECRSRCWREHEKTQEHRQHEVRRRDTVGIRNLSVVDPYVAGGAQRIHFDKGVSPSGRGAVLFFFSSRRRHTRSLRDWSSDVCSSDL